MQLINSWPTSESLLARAQRSVGAGGVSTGLRAQMQPHPLYFDRGEGAHLFDVDDHRYTDYVLGWGPVILGHAHPNLTKAVVDQAAKGATFGANHRAEFEVAEMVTAAVPGAERVLWSNTGSEADQIALRLSRAATGRQRFVKMVGHYHGWSDAFLLGYRPGADGGFDGPGTRGQSRHALEEVTLLPFGDLDAARAVLTDRSLDLAAVFLEPVLCNTGVVEPPEGYLEGLRELCDSTGTVLVFDEVITGFRLAYGGAAARYGVTPDLMVFAKAIAGGYPMAAVAGKAELIDLTLHGVTHAGTYNGGPLVLAAARATLQTLGEPGVYERLEASGQALAAGLRHEIRLAKARGLVTQVGPVVHCSLDVADGDGLTYFRSDQGVYDRVLIELLRRGVFALPGGRWYLSTAHTPHDIDSTVSAFGEALASVRELVS
jgi:glutamate-1-semialdehyde 2,1-aminomutase